MKLTWLAFTLDPQSRRSVVVRLLAGFMGMAIVSMGMGQKTMAEETDSGKSKPAETKTDDANLEKATFGGGCFWCTEAVFQRLKGVKSVVSGYSGGKNKNPTYEQVCSGRTGHAEVIQITYDPKLVTYPELLEVFWKTHDPTTLNRQGADRGTQYRSVVFYHNEKQKKLATEYKEKLDESGAFKSAIVTEISPLTEFYRGEDYHQNYYNDNPANPYCSTVIKYKVDKFREVFKDKLKTE